MLRCFGEAATEYSERGSQVRAQQKGAEMPQCPICKSEAGEIDLGLFDGAGFSCKRHGEFRDADSVFKESRARTRQQWENALVLAERRAALGTRPLITTYDF